MELENLKNYISQSEPEVNKLLRQGKDASNLTFDNLFRVGSIPQPLYRILPNNCVHINKDEFTDSAYLSYTEDIDLFIGHVTGDDIACLQFEFAQNYNRIVVNDLLPKFNHEKEIILPKGLTFSVNDIRYHSNQHEIKIFLKKMNSSISEK